MKLTFKYGDITVVAGFKKADGSPFGFSKFATHALSLIDLVNLFKASDSPPLKGVQSAYRHLHEHKILRWINC
jgi:hypothetical protein